MALTGPRLREAFVSGRRRLEVAFHTSSIEKFLQARVVFERSGLVLRHFRAFTDPYDEDYGESTHSLLAGALRQVRATVGPTALFFVEDTSLRIESLSLDGDFPGLTVKEWFARTNFDEVDTALRSRENDRRAVVKSDIALSIPGVREPLYFHGETAGTIAATPPQFGPNPIYPWLTPSTFNGWLIPVGAKRRLGEMEFEEAYRFDFRITALEELLDRLEQYAAVLNLPPRGYTRFRSGVAVDQLSIFGSTQRVMAVIGLPCAGKTTFGQRAESAHGWRYIEASDVMRMLAADLPSGLRDAARAHALLDAQGQDAIARRVVEIVRESESPGVVVTGFRLVEEIELLRELVPEATIVLLDASERTRYERCLRRARDADALTPQTFSQRDVEQGLFGLLPVAEDLTEVVLTNEGTMAEYLAAIDSMLSEDSPAEQLSARPPLRAMDGQLYRSLRVLADAGRPLTTAEIEDATTADGRPIRHNNANKVLKRHPALARRIEPTGSQLRYSISDSGRSYVRLVERRADLARKAEATAEDG